MSRRAAAKAGTHADQQKNGAESNHPAHDTTSAPRYHQIACLIHSALRAEPAARPVENHAEHAQTAVRLAWSSLHSRRPGGWWICQAMASSRASRLAVPKYELHWTIGRLSRAPSPSTVQGRRQVPSEELFMRLRRGAGAKHHQASSSIIKHHQASSSIIKHHQASPSMRTTIRRSVCRRRTRRLSLLENRKAKIVPTPPDGSVPIRYPPRHR